MGDELGQSFAFLPRSSHPWIWVFKPGKSSVEKFVCRGRLPACALSVEGPAENELRRTIVFSSHSPEPTVDKGGLPDTSPSDDANDVHVLVRQRSIQEGDILLSPKNIASGNRQSGYRDFLRSQSGRRPVYCGSRSSNGGLPQALKIDCLATGDSPLYRWHKPEQFGRSLEALFRVLVQQRLEKNDGRLRDVLELV